MNDDVGQTAITFPSPQPSYFKVTNLVVFDTSEPSWWELRKRYKLWRYGRIVYYGVIGDSLIMEQNQTAFTSEDTVI